MKWENSKGLVDRFDKERVEVSFACIRNPRVAGEYRIDFSKSCLGSAQGTCPVGSQK